MVLESPCDLETLGGNGGCLPIHMYHRVLLPPHILAPFPREIRVIHSLLHYDHSGSDLGD